MFMKRWTALVLTVVLGITSLSSIHAADLAGTGLVEKNGVWYAKDGGTGQAGFRTVGGIKRYFFADGVMARGVVKDGNKIFYFSWEDGAQQTGFVRTGTESYMYLKADGSFNTGIQKVGKDYYNFDSRYAVAKSGWGEKNGKTFYFDEHTKKALRNEGRMIVGNPYYFLDDGTMALQQFITVEGKSYYVDAGGSLKTGPQTIEGKDYYFSYATGELITGIKQKGNSYYYYDGLNGKFTGGEKEVDGVVYSFNASGAMINPPKAGMRYELGSDGKYSKRVLRDEAGNRMFGFFTSFGDSYYFEDTESGVREGNLEWIDGELYSFGSGGLMRTGHRSYGGKQYFFDETNGKSRTGRGKTVTGVYKYFNGDGTLGFGLQTSDGKTFLYEPVDGKEVYGFQNIEDKVYYFDPERGMIKDESFTVDGIHYQADRNGCLSVVSSAESSLGERFIAELFKHLGKHYHADLNQGVDCSGLVMKSLEPLGLKPKRDAYEQWYDFRSREEVEEVSSLDDLQPGDLLYYTTLDCAVSGCQRCNEIHHVGIYMGADSVIEALMSPFDLVTVRSLEASMGTKNENYLAGILRLTEAEQPEEGIPGDINGDGKVNIFDVIRLLKFVTGERVETFANRDVNADGKENIFDVIRLLKFVTGEKVKIQ